MLEATRKLEEHWVRGEVEWAPILPVFLLEYAPTQLVGASS